MSELSAMKNVRNASVQRVAVFLNLRADYQSSKHPVSNVFNVVSRFKYNYEHESCWSLSRELPRS